MKKQPVVVVVVVVVVPVPLLLRQPVRTFTHLPTLAELGRRYTGPEATLTLTLSVGAGQSSDIGTGSISTDGKLTLTLPETVAGDKLFSMSEMGLGDAFGGTLSISPTLYFAKDMEKSPILYLNKDVTVQGVMSLKKGWNYLKSSYDALVPDISGYKWVILQD
jgi:hypothetical protein